MNKYSELQTALSKSSHLIRHESEGVTDMDIIYTQALLMHGGNATFMAIKSGELANILVGLVALGYVGLTALTVRRSEVLEHLNYEPHAYLMVDIMRQLSHKIGACASGNAEDYSSLFRFCAHLATDFLNADFDKALWLYHDWRMCHPVSEACDFDKDFPELTDCLYE